MVIGSFTISCLEEYTEFMDDIEECGNGKFQYILIRRIYWVYRLYGNVVMGSLYIFCLEEYTEFMDDLE